MPDLGSILERESRSVAAPEPSMDRLLRRRERRLRNQRIAAGAVALMVAAAGIGWNLFAFRIERTTQPASGGGPTQTAPNGGGWLGVVLPTVAIWIGVAVLGLTVLAIVRLRRRPAHAVAHRTTSAARAAPGHGPAADTGAAGSEGGNEMNSKSDIRTPQAKILGVPAGPSQAVAHRKGLGGPWLALALVLAVLVGALGGYLLRWAVEPTRTATKAATRTVAPPAYTTSTDVEARVTFDGSTCAYSGPAEVAAGTFLHFAYTASEGLASAMAVVPVRADMTYEDVVRDAETGEADNPPDWALPNVTSDPAGAPQQWLSTRLLSEGLRGIVCITSPETTNDVFMGTMIRVVGS